MGIGSGLTKSTEHPSKEPAVGQGCLFKLGFK